MATRQRRYVRGNLFLVVKTKAEGEFARALGFRYTPYNQYRDATRQYVLMHGRWADRLMDEPQHLGSFLALLGES